MEYSKKYRQTLLPEEHDFFGNCHASTIVHLDHDNLLVSFFAGSKEGAGDTAIWLARRNGKIWQTPQPLLQEDGLAHWNPVLHRQGNTVWLFYKVGPSVHTWTTRWVISHDSGASWSTPVDLVTNDPLPRGPVKNKLLVLSSSEWLAPGSIETEETWDAFVDLSADEGQTWHKHDVPLVHPAQRKQADKEIWQGLRNDALWESDLDRVFAWDGIIQPTLWESAPGNVHMLTRSTRGHIYRSDSFDAGRTWCPAYATSLPNNNSGIDVAHLGGGKLALAFNPVSGNWSSRNPLSLSFSHDNGVHWDAPIDLERGMEEDEFSYPAIIAVGNTLHVTYTFNRRNIIHQEINLT